MFELKRSTKCKQFHSIYCTYSYRRYARTFCISLFCCWFFIFALQLSGSNGKEYHFKHRVLQHARTRRSIPHTRVLKREPLVCIELLSFSSLYYMIIIFTLYIYEVSSCFNNGDEFSILLKITTHMLKLRRM